MKLMEFENACGQSLSLKVVTSLSTALYRREDDNQGMDFLYPKGSRQLFYTIFIEAYIMIRISYTSQAEGQARFLLWSF